MGFKYDDIRPEPVLIEAGWMDADGSILQRDPLSPLPRYLAVQYIYFYCGENIEPNRFYCYRSHSETGMGIDGKIDEVCARLLRENPGLTLEFAVACVAMDVARGRGEPTFQIWCERVGIPPYDPVIETIGGIEFSPDPNWELWMSCLHGARRAKAVFDEPSYFKLIGRGGAFMSLADAASLEDIANGRAAPECTTEHPWIGRTTLPEAARAD